METSLHGWNFVVRHKKRLLIVIGIISISIIAVALTISMIQRQIQISTTTTMITTSTIILTTSTSEKSSASTTTEEELSKEDIRREKTTYIFFCLLLVLPYNLSITNTTIWRQNGVTVRAGLLFDHIDAILVDDDERIYFSQNRKNSISELQWDREDVRTVFGGEEYPFFYPGYFVIEKESDSFIFCDTVKKQIVRGPRENARNAQILISDIHCYGLAMDDQGFLYVSDISKHEVKRWEIGMKTNQSILVAGGHTEGSHLRALYYPTAILLDRDSSLYVLDIGNARVMKWMKDAKEGLIVAGGNGSGYGLNQIRKPVGLILDRLGNIYIADTYNYRVMRWLRGATEGSIIVGGNGLGNRSFQFTSPMHLWLDKDNHLYVYDQGNYRIQKFFIQSN